MKWYIDKYRKILLDETQVDKYWQKYYSEDAKYTKHASKEEVFEEVVKVESEDVDG